MLSRRVYANCRQFANLDELKAAIVREGADIDEKVLPRVSYSVLRKIEAVMARSVAR